MESKKMSVVLLLCLYLAAEASANDIILPYNVSSCNGAFDVYFVLDLSSSLLKDGTNHFREETVSFVKQLVKKFTNLLLRFSLITFNDEANVEMSLTSDRNTVEENLMRLRQAVPDGDTNLNLGLERATDLIREFSQKRASVIIVLTDGILQYSDKKKSVIQSGIARSLGATVIAIGVANFDPKQLLQIVGGYKQLLFKAASFQGLNGIVKKVADQSCVEITEAILRAVCSDNTTFMLHIHGRGFNKTGSYKDVKCQFLINKKISYLVTPTSYSPTHLTCPQPDGAEINFGDDIDAQVTLNNGVSFISSQSTTFADSCGPILSGFALAMIFTLTLLFLFAIWWFGRAFCCKLDDKKEKKNSIRPMPPPPPIPHSPTATVTEIQQWPTVDASYYGGRGAGGINPMKVSWGERGCTDAGMQLEPAKNAKEVGFVSREVALERSRPTQRPPRPSPPQSSCCQGLNKSIFGPFISLYTGLAERRPSATDIKNCKCIKPSSGPRTKARTSVSSVTGGYLDTRN